MEQYCCKPDYSQNSDACALPGIAPAPLGKQTVGALVRCREGMDRCTSGKMQRNSASGSFFQPEKMNDERFRAFFVSENQAKVVSSATLTQPSGAELCGIFEKKQIAIGNWQLARRGKPRP